MLASVFNTFGLDDNVTLETKDDRAFCHDEADITMISYVLVAANYGKDTPHIHPHITQHHITCTSV